MAKNDIKLQAKFHIHSGGGEGRGLAHSNLPKENLVALDGVLAYTHVTKI